MQKIQEKGTNWTILKFERRMQRKSSLRIKNIITKHLWQWKTAADIAIQQEDMRLKQNKIHVTNNIITQTIIRQLLYANALESIYAVDILNIKGTGGRNRNVCEVRKI